MGSSELRPPSGRAVFGLERVWLAADRLGAPFVNQLVVELDGEPDPAALHQAIGSVLPVWPAARARVSGWLGRARWTGDGAPPRVVGPAPMATDRGPAAFERVHLDPWTGPIVEWVFGPHPAGGSVLVLRTHHAAFDGRAAWALAEDLGVALRGGSPRGARFDGVVEPAGGVPSPEPPADAPAPTGAPSGASGVSWVRGTLPAGGTKLLPRALVALAGAAGGGRLRLSVPVDLRDRLPPDARRAAANLTGFVELRVAPGDDPATLGEALRAAIAGPSPLGALRAGDSVRGVPIWLMEQVGRRGAARAAATGVGTTSGTVSNLGRLDRGVFDHARCRGRSCYWIPPTNPGTPCFLTLTGHDGGVEVVVGMPNTYGDGGRIERFADRFRALLAG